MSEPTINFTIQTRQVQFSVPTELIKKNLKSIQKLVEKQKKQTADEVTRIKALALPKSEKLQALRRLIQNAENYQKRLRSAIDLDAEYRLRLVARKDRLRQLADFTLVEKDDDRVLDLHNEALVGWYRDETNLLIADYLVKLNRSKDENVGYKLMKSLSGSTNLDVFKLVDYDVYQVFNQVFLSIHDHNLDLVTAWYTENRNSLKKLNSNLQFEIHYCKYHAMIKEGNVWEAIQYSKTHLAPYGNMANYTEDELPNYDKNLPRLTKVGAPLVFMSAFDLTSSVSAETSVFSRSSDDAFAESIWSSLLLRFVDDFVQIYGIPKTYPLLVYLAAGLSSLKTKSCYCNNQNTVFAQEEYNEVSTNLDLGLLRDLALRLPNQYYRILKKTNQCPVCLPELHQLSKNLPFAQLITSIFDNPFRLPNGNIYPFDRLVVLQAQESPDALRVGKIHDPLTQEVFFIDDCVKVFPA